MMAAETVVAHPTSMEDLRYMSRDGFVTGVTIGERALDGEIFTLSGDRGQLLDMLDEGRMTVLNFGSCT